MKIKKMISVIFLALCGTIILAGGLDNKPSFTRLKEAVSFIVACLDQDATNRFDAAFIGSMGKSKMHQNVFVGLQRINKNVPLISLYQGKEFPTNRHAFRLGGHFKELGCINIRFIKTNEVWQLTDAFYCR